jgi:hypothetical protein
MKVCEMNGIRGKYGINKWKELKEWVRLGGGVVVVFFE